MKIIFSVLLIITIKSSFAQTASYDFYNVTPIVGNGIRLWGSDFYKIHFGNTSEYLYGPVTDYSIKMNMSGQAGQGWVWGVAGTTPVASLDNQGNMQIAGKFGIGINPSSKLDISDANTDLSIVKLRNSAWACNQRTSIEFWNGGNKNYPTSRVVSQMDGCGAQGEALLFETQTAGQTAPSAKLIIKNDGSVGIGTTTPTKTLEVSGDASVNSLYLRNAWNDARIVGNGENIEYRSSWYHAFYGITNSSPAMFLDARAGNLGIGTTAPDAKLTVKGQVHAQEVKVDLNGAVALTTSSKKITNSLR